MELMLGLLQRISELSMMIESLGMVILVLITERLFKRVAVLRDILCPIISLTKSEISLYGFREIDTILFLDLF